MRSHRSAIQGEAKHPRYVPWHLRETAPAFTLVSSRERYRPRRLLRLRRLRSSGGRGRNGRADIAARSDRLAPGQGLSQRGPLGRACPRLPTDPPGPGIARPLPHEAFVFGPTERGEPGSYSPRSFDLRMVGGWASVPVALAVRSCCSVDTRAYPTRGSFILPR
jgi:hypothetical protein